MHTGIYKPMQGKLAAVSELSEAGAGECVLRPDAQRYCRKIERYGIH
jgi:hypothetical protein